MKKYSEIRKEIIHKNPDVKREIELLALKYDLIRLLTDYRKENNITQKEFAETIRVKQQMISRFEKGDVDPRLSFVAKIIRGMNCRVEFVDFDYKNSSVDIESISKKENTIPNLTLCTWPLAAE